ncbi:hypothetical protein QVD17_28072 [Tagetes erecta]|uniref:NB-ARC domains-containing protein n=1 Tax=Tagetes erecta TaxID=13708 RepID=A0AAD8KA46_TARER|nr:hypothetical protein QVD17_28072 [Tagetes erecta]
MSAFSGVVSAFSGGFVEKTKLLIQLAIHDYVVSHGILRTETISPSKTKLLIQLAIHDYVVSHGILRTETISPSVSSMSEKSKLQRRIQKSMAEILLSAFLGVLFEKLASTTLKNFVLYKGIDAEIKRWQRSLNQIQDVLTDASQKEITNQSVKRWLNDLQHLAYDIDDVLDDLAYQAMDREFNHESSKPITRKVRNIIPSCCTNFSRNSKLHEKLDIISAKLQDLLEEKATLGLSVKGESRSKNINRRLQTSMVHASSVVGRQAEKEALVQRLLGDEPCDQNFSIVPIVGMGGVGKTTLARLLYDEKQVKDHFELKAWVCVSDEFDSFGISKVIFQSVSGLNKEFADLNLLQVALRDHLREKRFLLVLDDIWSESYEDWETLVGPFYACATGSKIIMTTRKEQLIKKLGCNHLNPLQSLPHDDAMSLVALHALGVNNFDLHLSLKPYAEGIVKKCDGLPLALIALGRLLRTKKDEEEYWKNVLSSEIWRLQDGGVIVPALRLSYHDLSGILKQLFAYCSLFPKDFLFDKEELVLLWMAEGFLHPSTLSDSNKEQLGHEYFDELMSRSFFQHAPNNKSLFVMHDLINDLATSIADEFYVKLDNLEEKNISKEMLEKYRHMSFVREEYVTYKKFEPFKRAKSLRTLLATSVGVVESWQSFYLSNKVLADLLLELPLLRVLCLSNFVISEVPESIGTLRHLTYLNLSRTAITHLPKNVSNLYKLQTLIVSSCHCLDMLPKSFLKLKNLRHLDIRDTPLLNWMPIGLGELKGLQTLSKIVLGVWTKCKMQNATHAREANFSQKRLSELEVVWSCVVDGSRNKVLEKEVLNELKPCTDYLKQLKIRSYGGLDFPIWVGDPSFLRLKHVEICGCKKCTSLPPLGQLPSLKKLLIKGLEMVKVVGMELLGTGLACPSLKTLIFVDMPGWEKWSINSGVVFPCLQKLKIEDCPKLVEVALESLPSLASVEIIGCNNFVVRRVVEVSPSVTKLKIECISGLNDVVWRGVIEYLVAIEELSIFHCNEIRYLWESEEFASKVLVKLRNLEVFACDNLVSLGERVEEADSCRRSLLTSLRVLNVSQCNNMECCRCPDNVETLGVFSCTSITSISLPIGAHKLKSLDIINCKKLLEREWGGQNMTANRNNMPMLEYVSIECWSNLKSITELNYLVHLTELRISRCESMESFPDNELPNLTLLKDLEITNCPSMDASFPRGFWPPKLRHLKVGKLKKPVLEWGPQNLPTSLVELYLCCEDGVGSCNQFRHLLPSSLTSLEIIEFEKLESFSMGLQHLTLLQHLSFYDCPNLMDLPEVLFPSLLSLTISGCPNLNERCSKSGSYWPLISHIPCISIYP